MKKKNRLPKAWLVHNDGSKDFQKVIDYINDNDDFDWAGDTTDLFYGHDGEDFICTVYPRNTLILTIKQFTDMTTEEEYTRGEIVQTRDVKHDEWYNRIYLGEIEGSISPYITVHSSYEKEFRSNEEFSISNWTQIRKKQDELKVTLTLNGEEVDPSTLSKKSWDALRNK